MKSRTLRRVPRVAKRGQFVVGSISGRRRIWGVLYARPADGVAVA
jgi:hypothetical protein